MTPPPEMFNLAAYVLAHATQTPEKTALTVIGHPQASWTYAELADQVQRTAAGLLAQGLVAGDRVLMRLGNSADFPCVYLASIAVGIIPVPTSAQLTRHEINKICSEIEPKLIVAAPGVALPDAPIRTVRAAELLADSPAAYVMGDPNRLAYIVYTSGTSGKPRAVMHAHRAIWARRLMWDGWYGLRADDRLMHAGAFNWTYTLGTGLMDPWAIGATALIPQGGTAVEELPAMMAQHEASIFAAAPGVYRRMLRSPLPALPTLRHGLSAGEKLPDATRAAWIKATGTPIHEAYGMSECSTFISGCPERPAPAGTLGHPQPGRAIALLGPDGPSDTGVIAIDRNDPGLMLGYLNQPEETANRFQGAWFLTGDLGQRTAGGAIAFLGRADDMMNAGGFRVSPVEVEDVLSHFAGLGDVACAEVRVSQTTTLIAAFYTASAKIDEDALAAFAKRQLAAYKLPRLYVRVASLPRGANNKLLRQTLRAEWEATHGQA